MTAEARVESTSAGVWTLRLVTQVDGQSRTRTLEAPSCGELAQATALALGLEAGVDETNERETMPPVAAAETQGPRAPSRAEPEHTPAHGNEPSSSVGFGLAGALDVGSLGSAAPGASMSVSWLPGKARLEVDGLLLPTVQLANSSTGIGAALSMLAGGAKGCWSVLAHKLDVAACGGAEAGRVLVRGQGPALESSSEASRGWFAVRAGALLTYPVGIFTLRAEPELVVPLLRDRFVVTGIDTVHTAAPVALRALLGLEVQFPQRIGDSR
ncbi:hypothetical protein AKJ09_08707 [Labilithrix luteola]|uniref:Uncharacterized protein n=1 Tax=Labilithrix luteola TaxID=1391654 RepID=A0A0K1Q8I7_9BACT|nr:hypothetical protein AKJ09_08707 [Labilithrix luteola]